MSSMPAQRSTSTAREHWILFASIIVAGLGLAWLLVALPAMETTGDWAMDFVAYREAALRVAQGGSAYLPSTLAGPFLPYGDGLYMYPPVLALAIRPVAELDPAASAVAWYLLHVAALVVSAALMPVRAPIRLVTFGVASVSLAVIVDSMNGNVSTLLLVPMAAAWRWLDRPAASVAVAVATSVRTTFGLFLVWMLLRRAWRPAIWTVMAGATLLLISAVVVGIDGYREYLTVLGNVSVADEIGSSDLARFAFWLGAPAADAWMANIVGWVLALAAIGLGLRRDAEVGFMVTLGASLLTAPLMWEHYLTLVMLTGAFLAARGRAWGLLLLPATWLPDHLLAFVAIAATLLPFLAREREQAFPALPGVSGRRAMDGSDRIPRTES